MPGAGGPLPAVGLTPGDLAAFLYGFSLALLREWFWPAIFFVVILIVVVLIARRRRAPRVNTAQ